MATKTSTQELDSLTINRVASEDAYRDMVRNNQVNENELYFVEGDVDPLPSQTGNSGKFLTTNGTDASWATIEVSDEIFVAEYNVTTFEEVRNAYLAGKTIICKFDHDHGYAYKYLNLAGVSSPYGVDSMPVDSGAFSFTLADTGGEFDCWLDPDGWENSYFNNYSLWTSRLWTGTCGTASSTAEKKVTLDYSANFSLSTGKKIAVTFTNGFDSTINLNNVAPKLNVASTGAKDIIVSTSISTSTSDRNLISWGGGDTVFFTYDGTSWMFEGSALNQYKAYYNKLDKSGGTMSGSIAMGSNKITGLSNGTSANDAVNYSQLTSLIKTAAGTIATNATSAAVSYTGTLLGAYAVMGGDRIETDMAVTASTVTFSTADYPDSAVTCTVIYM